ncbi:conserved Plasmodium protein, unknown function [Plasmodium gaboni]|uniref:Leucine-rich repeat protein n=2 Tax=Plasmodium gaboni TaxID=647221 RepID=A0ABY1UTX1_9APIC|nr:conserved Plasmodium protein, unknown function [Plasmodium gaboni]
MEEKNKNVELITSDYIENEILEKYDIFSKAYSSSDNLSFVDSEEDQSAKNLDDSKKKNILSLTVHNIINIYPNNERNREFKKYKEKKIEEKRKKHYEEEKEIIEQKKKIYEEKRKIKLEKYKVEKMKKKLIEREKYNKENIEYNYITIFNYFDYLMTNRKHYDIYFSFHDLYISPMRLYYFINMNIDEIYYLDMSRKWLSDNYVSIILELCSCKKVKILNLSYNKISYKSIKLFCDFLKENKFLFYLSLENNDLTNQGNKGEVINELFDVLRNNKSIKILNLANTNMKKENAERLCSMLEINKIITDINIENNNFTSDQNYRIISYLMRNKKIWIEQAEREKAENEKMEKEENYMHTYIMSVESSIIEIENRERRRSLNKMMYINMWKEEIREKELKEEAIHQTLEKEHEKRIKTSQRKKKKKKKK